MRFPILHPEFTRLERHQFRSLVVKDTLALLSVTIITIMLAVATYFLFGSYKTHQHDLANRWLSRGQSALAGKKPKDAINDFRSALLYAPGQRQIEVALASALASDGRIQEATAYFNTLREAEPGNGQINLQLARLSARTGNEESAKLYYHAAIYGNWDGDGYIRRRDARLELIRYLISRGRFEEARTELMISSGNAPATDVQFQMLVAGLLVEAQDKPDALAAYRTILMHDHANTTALVNAAHIAFDLGQYQLAHHFLVKVQTAAGTREQSKTPTSDAADLLHRVNRVLLLDTAVNLPPTAIAQRILSDRQIALKRFQDCSASTNSSAAPNSSAATSAAPLLSTSSSPTPAPIAGPLAELAGLWSAAPPHLTANNLAMDPDLEAQEKQLIADTEITTAKVCGAPANPDDEALLQLARVPSRLNGDSDHE